MRPYFTTELHHKISNTLFQKIARQNINSISLCYAIDIDLHARISFKQSSIFHVKLIHTYKLPHAIYLLCRRHLIESTGAKSPKLYYWIYGDIKYPICNVVNPKAFLHHVTHVRIHLYGGVSSFIKSLYQ